MSFVTTTMSMHFADFDTDAFLRDYWQKKPLLIRNPWQSWSNPVDPDELAGLACEDHVDSRIVRQEDDAWRHEEGPMPEERFAALGPAPWTLLVQSVDHHVPAVAELVEPFRFIPDWRIDDVMVSYAVDGGGVGAHFDQYDVFLVQGLGRRRWQVGDPCSEDTPLLGHDHLRLLADFKPTQEWVLEPGDILYVPPRFAHKGVAVGDDCMTYSVGFRAPSRHNLIAGWTDSVLDRLDDDDRFTDSDLAAQVNPGEIAGSALSRLQAMITEAVVDRSSFARWFGEYSTSPKNPEIDWQLEQPVTGEEVREALKNGDTLIRNPASRFAFVRQDDGGLSLFVDGNCFECAGDLAMFAEALCAQRSLVPDSALAGVSEVQAVIVDLINQGSVAFTEQAKG